MTFYLSKILWIIINPFNLILFLVFFSYFSFLIKLKLISRILNILIISLFIICGFLPTGNYLNYLLEKKFHNMNVFPNVVDGILILSGATKPSLSKEHKQVNLNSSAERLVESVMLINKYPSARIIFSGGSGSINKNEPSHSDVAKKFYNNMNIPFSRIIYEQKSRNTYENILYSKKIAKPKKNEIWLLVTSASHLNRSIAIAEKLNWEFIPYPTDFNSSKKFYFKISLNFLSNFNNFQKSSHEWVGIIAYYFMNRSSSIF